MERCWIGLVALLAGVLLAATASAQEYGSEWDEPVDDGTVGLRAGIGFTADPGTFLMALGLPLEFGESVALGPYVQFGIDDHATIVAPGASLEYRFDTSRARDPIVRRLIPFMQAGAAGVFIHKERRGNDDDEVGLNISVGFGLEYLFRDGIAVGSNMRFNALPFEVSDEHFFFSWEVATVRLRF
jgi:hypothetical protein